ncbi:hypothetical protein [Streptomyces poonensis]|uniref:Uncharacterized protein n=1 Tax=Streptomyces poonensis TaxID=68255 RepID=A0A918Q7Z0_9ACTN|nr:hypothetical protein [Streptomyces poonensis]GGZ34295.1 hypothetical protein GCM10010365_64020 [Streptomyces poonensis]GLJ89284.1 hypothetical protein GCM10017589_18840 [Streptomyces poonensis]
MTDLAKKRFAQLGQQLQYDQLSTVRRQAEGWRNGLTGLTGLVGVVFVLKGRESVAGMPGVWRWTTALLLVAAFVLLLAGALCAVRAAHGQLGQGTWLSGERLLAAVLDEVERTQSAVITARRLSIAGLSAIVIAIAVSWLVPVKNAADPAGSGKDGPYVLVVTDRGTECGTLVVGDAGAVTIKQAKAKAESDKEAPQKTTLDDARQWHRIPADDVRSVVPTDGC